MAAGLGRGLGATLLAGRGRAQASRPTMPRGRGTVGAHVSAAAARVGAGTRLASGRGRPPGPQQGTKPGMQPTPKQGSQAKPSPAGRATASGSRAASGKGAEKGSGLGKLAFQVKTTKKLTGPVKPLAAQS